MKSNEPVPRVRLKFAGLVTSFSTETRHALRENKTQVKQKNHDDKLLPLRVIKKFGMVQKYEYAWNRGAIQIACQAEITSFQANFQ